MTKSLKITATVVGAAVIITAAYVWHKYRDWVNNFDYGMGESIKPKSLTWNSLELDIPVWIHNPTPVGFIISNADLNVFVEGLFIGKITSANYKIKAKETSSFILSVKSDNKGVLEFFKQKGNLFSDPDWRKKIKVTVNGTLGIYAGPIFIRKIPVEFTEKLQSFI
jgi:LEA14-like dessication related protein